MARSTDQQLEERVAAAAALRLQGTTPSATMAKLVADYGVSIRQARRYLALANEELREEGLDPSPDLFRETATMAMQRAQLLLVDANPAELHRLVAAMGKLHEMTPAGPTLSDADLINRAAFTGGAAALGQKDGPEPWKLD
jgi:hypothetical protein